MKKFSVIFFALILALFCISCGSTTSSGDDEDETDTVDSGSETGDTTPGGDTDTSDTTPGGDTDTSDTTPGGDTDTDTDTGSEEPAATGVITKIQKGEIAENTEVTTECVVTAILYAQDTETHENTAIKGVYVSELIKKAQPYSGIYVFIKATAALDEYEIGDKLEVSGKYTEYYESSQIEAAEIKKLGKADVPEPAEIEDTTKIATPFEENEASAENCKWEPTANHGADAEAYESVLVKVEDVTVTNANICHGAFEVTGNLAIDKTLYYYKGKRSEGKEFESIQGVLIYSYDAFRLAPRAQEDFVEGDNADTGDTGPTPPDGGDTGSAEIETTTIKAIQSGTKAKKDLVKIENAIVISPVLSKNFDDGTTGYTFYVSDGNKGDYSGLYIYQVTAEAAPAKGDKVTIEGQVDFYGNQWEVKNAKNAGSITKTGTGTVPAALEKAYTALSDADKGSLIEINELTVKSVEKPEGKDYTKITFEEKVKNKNKNGEEEEKELIAENFGNVTFQTYQAGDVLYVKGIYDSIFGSNGFYILNANDIEKRIY